MQSAHSAMSAARRSVASQGRAEGGLGWLPALSITTAVGLLMVALAYNAARQGAQQSALWRWLGLLALFTPVAARLLAPQPSRQERIGLLIALGLALFLARVLYSPLEFQFSDELQHWRSALNVLEGGRLFHYNHILPISPLYPGLENVTAALVSLGGLPLFPSAVLVIGLARLLCVLALFVLYEQLSGSAWVAGVASLIYICNPYYQSFDAMFIYQALALPLAVFALWLTARMAAGDDGPWWGAALALLLGAVTVTHHLTDFGLAALLTLWALIALRLRRGGWEQWAPVGAALLGVAMGVAWMVGVAPAVIDYVAEPLARAVDDLLLILKLGPAALSRLFQGPSSPPVELVLYLGSVALILAGLPLGMRQIWRRCRNVAPALAMAIASLSYLLSLAIRLTSAGALLAGRTWSFVFVPVAFVLAMGVGALRERAGARPLLYPALLGCSLILFFGGMVAGWPPPWGRLPGPFLPGASERSVEPQGVAVAQWTAHALGPSNRILGDFTNNALLGAYGGQDPVYGPAALFTAPQWGASERAALLRRQIRYVLVDRRLSAALPARGFYYEPAEAVAARDLTPVDPAALAKFDLMPRISRIFDSGDIILYDVGILRYEQ